MGEWRPQIAASILTADFGHLDRVVRKLEKAGVDRLHLDVMDGHFVPNITFGPNVVAAFRRLPRFLEARPETITFHVEAHRSSERIADTLRVIRAGGSEAGLAVSPGTPVRAVLPYLPMLDVIMIMTVEPGFGGQRFLADAAPKLSEAAGLFGEHGGRGAVHVDGGVSRDTAAIVGAWGAEVCVVGSALFQRGRDTADEVRLVREGVMEGRRTGPATDHVAVDRTGLVTVGPPRRIMAAAPADRD
jgi:ribulose-phosphate 3-epimerase